jgi:hypothetical protein
MEARSPGRASQSHWSLAGCVHDRMEGLFDALLLLTDLITHSSNSLRTLESFQIRNATSTSTLTFLFFAALCSLQSKWRPLLHIEAESFYHRFDRRILRMP